MLGSHPVLAIDGFWTIPKLSVQFRVILVFTDQTLKKTIAKRSRIVRLVLHRVFRAGKRGCSHSVMHWKQLVVLRITAYLLQIVKHENQTQTI